MVRLALCLVAALWATPAVSQVEQGTDPSGGSFFHQVNFRNFKSSDQERVLQALDAIAEVVQSEKFRQAVLGFKNNRGKQEFLENNGLSNAQIHELLLEGAERLRPVPDRTLDLDITWYYKNNRTVGYTYKSSNRIWVNSKFYRRYSVPQMSRNLFHEWTHKMGFGHVRYSNRPWTVPYGLGKKMEALVAEHLRDQ